MKCFEIVLKGFRGDTDKTDHLIKWIKAESLSVLKKWLKKKKMTQSVRSIYPMQDGSKYGFADGVDVILTGKRVLSKRSA